MLKTTISVLLMLFGLTQAEITMDRNITHGHDEKFFNHTMKRMEYDQYFVHLIPHTHDDVGWLKNPDEYFSGTAMNTLQYAYVELIIDSVIEALLADPVKKFSYVEMKFFQMWWIEQTEDMKNQVRMLVDEGRLEIINGGWSMNDEACPHYEDIINNMLIGHKFLKEELGVTPRIGWHVDPFGHSNAQPRLFAEMGFDAWFFARLDYQDKEKRLEEKTMEWVWRPFYDSLGSRAQIFTHALYHHYSAPDGFCFDVRCNDEPIVDDPTLETYNIDRKVDDFYAWVIHQKEHYKTNHLFITMGDDFNFMNAAMYFGSMDKLMTHFNAKYPNVTLIYSTPSNYIDALKSLDLEWPTKYDDMFPYADGDTSYWTGYFTSRSNDKSYIRRGSYNLMASNKLFALKAIDQTVEQETVDAFLKTSHLMFDVMGVNQHHDAVTGTGKQAVANDYAWRIYKGLESNNAVYQSFIEEAASNIAGVNSNSTWEWCFKENGTYLDCPIANYDKKTANFIVAVHNPSSLPLNYQRIALPHGNYDVHGFNTNTAKFEKVSGSALCENVVLENNAILENCELYVKHTVNASHIGFLSLSYNPTTDLRATKNTNVTNTSNTTNTTNFTSFSIENDFETLTFVKSCPVFGEIFTLTKKEYNQTFTFAFDLRWWPAFQQDGQQNSGDYIFRPADGVYDSLKYTILNHVSYTTSAIASEIHLGYFNETSGTSADVFIRLYEDAAFSEWFVELGSVPDLGTGTEITVNWLSFDIDNNRTFYTDSNGLEMQERILNYRPTWEWSGKQNITANYYPVQTAVAIRDTNKTLQMTVMNSRSQGGSVINQGRIEIMQHRRLYYDDGRGMGEALDERDSLGNAIVVPAQYFLQIFNYEEEPSLQRHIQLRQDEPAQYFFQFDGVVSKVEAPVSQTFATPMNNLESLLSNKDFNDVLKVSLFPIKKNVISLRVENIGDLFDESSAAPLKLNVHQLAEDLFVDVNGGKSALAYINIEETSLTGNQAYSEMWAKKIQWRTVDDSTGDVVNAEAESLYGITLEKQRIRTFQIEYVIGTTPNAIIDIMQ